MNQSSSLMYKCPFKAAEADKDTRNSSVCRGGLGFVDYNATKNNSLDS